MKPAFHLIRASSEVPPFSGLGRVRWGVWLLTAAFAFALGTGFAGLGHDHGEDGGFGHECSACKVQQSSTLEFSGVSGEPTSDPPWQFAPQAATAPAQTFSVAVPPLRGPPVG